MARTVRRGRILQMTEQTRLTMMPGNTKIARSPPITYIQAIRNKRSRDRQLYLPSAKEDNVRLHKAEVL